MNKVMLVSVLRSQIYEHTNFVEVSGHNLQSFCMVFLNHRKGGMVFYQVFLLSPLQGIVSELECEET
jgi:hypothetical protein